MEKIKQLIIIGGGTSISEGIEKRLWERIESCFVIGLNYSFRYFKNPTIQCFVDIDFYKEQKKNLKYLPLIIGKHHTQMPKLDNTISLNCGTKYYRDLNPTIYKSSLCGLFALSLGIYLLDEGEIFLLGADYGEKRKGKYEEHAKSKEFMRKNVVYDAKGRALTHFYQDDFVHKGSGKISYYNMKDRAEKDYGVYKEEKKVKIFNVSLISKIPSSIFPKISYDEFFKKLDNNICDQDELREEIKKKCAIVTQSPCTKCTKKT